MTDELKRLREELRAAEPRVVARAKGMNAAMRAFEEEFSSENDSQSEANIPSPKGRGMGEGNAAATAVSNSKTLTPTLSQREREQKELKNSHPAQGSDTQRRLTGQNAPRGGAKIRRRSMSSRIPTLNMMFSGTAIAASLAALIVLPNIKDDFLTDTSRGDLADIQTELDTFAKADKAEDVQMMAEASPPAPSVGAAESTLQVVDATYNNVSQSISENGVAEEASERLEVVPTTFRIVAETVVVEGESGGLVVRPATYKAGACAAASALPPEGPALVVTPAAPSPVAIPGQTGTTTTRVVDAPAGVRRVAVPGKTATIQTRVVSNPASTRAVAVPFDSATIQMRAPAAPADGIAAGKPSKDRQLTYSVRRVAIPGKTATISKRIRQLDGSFKTVTKPVISEEPSESIQIHPGGAGATIRAPKGYRLVVKPATYKSVGDAVVVAEDFDGTPLETRKIVRRIKETDASVMFVPIDPESGLQPLAVDPKKHIIAQPEVRPQPVTRDRFESVEDYPTVASREEPVSTFSIDADTASYSYMRASLNRGQLPNPSSIRVEELVNYFAYDYDAPTDAQEPFKASVTVTPTPWNADTKLMHIGIKGYTPAVAERPNANIVLLIDTSGSMNHPNKLPLLINSFKLLLDTLGEDDTVSIVTYAGSAGTVLEPTPANERTKIVAAFDRLRAGGSTAGAAGLELAYNKAQESFDENGINRVILATDGDFNVGFRSPDDMKTFVEKKRETGVFLSVLGFGMGNYNDHLMQTLAQNGNGVAAYIDTLSEARKVLADESGGALISIAKDVKIQVEFNPAQISEYRLIGYETRALKRKDFNNDKVDAGEIGAGHTVTAIYELSPVGSPAETIDELRYAEAEAAPIPVSGTKDEYAFVKIRYKLPNEDTSTLISRSVGMNDVADRLGAASTETRFAAAVAAFGQMLRRGSRVGDYSYEELIALASAAKGNDEFGYRSEFINLVRLAKSLDTTRQ